MNTDKTKKGFTVKDFEKGLMLAGYISPINVTELNEREALNKYELKIESMKLTKENLEEWVSELNRIIFREHGIECYSATMRSDWLVHYEGYTAQDAYREEMSHW